MKTISIIVAIAENNAIGKDNKLLWHLPDDLKRFKRLTSGHPVIMGKKTFESLPIKPLPNRTNIVLTDIPDELIEGCVMAYSIEDALSKCPDGEECFVMGGGMVYKQFLEIADRLYITYIHKNFDADTFFPTVNYDDWTLVEEEKHEDEGNHGFSFTYTLYEKIS